MLERTYGACFRRKKISISPEKWIDRYLCTILRRPLLVLLICCLIGSYISFFGSKLTCVLTVLLFSVIGGAVCFSGRRKFVDLITVLIGTLGFSLCFIGFLLWKNHEARLDISELYNGKAKVCSSNASDDGFKNVELLLEDGERIILLTDQTLNYGDSLWLKAKISPIITKGNPGDMDVRQYYRRKGIVRSAERADFGVSEPASMTPVNLGYQAGAVIRRIFNDIWTESTDEETASVMSAMILGDGSRLSKADKSMFKKSNLSHLLVVSGAHVGYFTATVGTLCALVLDEKNKIFGLTAFLLLFGFVTGWAGSASRSILMYLIIGYLSFFKRCIDRLSACSLSALIIMLFDPFAIFSSGLLLSFGATFSIMIFHKNTERILFKYFSFVPEEIRRAVSCFICAHIGMVPVLLGMGNALSLSSAVVVVFSGFPAEMICSLGLVLSVFSLIFPIRGVRTLLFMPVRGMVSILKNMAYIGSMHIGGSLVLRRVPMLLLVSVVSFLLWALNRPGIRRNLLFLLAVGAFLGSVAQIILFKNDRSSIYFLDVGQGDCALITHGEVAILVDGGNQGNGETIRKTMEYLGISRIDMAFISHLDADHISGILELSNLGLVDHLYAPFWSESPEMDQLLALFPEIPSDVTILNKNSVVNIDEDLSFQVIWPQYPTTGGNDDSMVLVCSIYGAKVLFTGDITKETEKELDSSEIRDIQLLKVAHHGSRFSTSDEFLNDKMIDAAVISVGYNHYGHPSAEVLDRLSEHEIPCFRTDERGCVLLTANENGWDLDYYFGS